MNESTWKEELMDDFCVMFSRADREVEPIDWVERMEEFIENRMKEAYARGRRDAVEFVKSETKWMKALMEQSGIQTKGFELILKAAQEEGSSGKETAPTESAG